MPQHTEERPHSWLPLYGWGKEDDTIHTSLVVTPPLITENIDNDTFYLSLSCYKGSKKPLWKYDYPHKIQKTALRLPLKEVKEALGLKEIDGILEIFLRNENLNPPINAFYETWFLHASSDNAFSVSVPALAVRGSLKTFLGYKYLPGIVCSEQNTTDIVLINPFTKPIEVRVELFSLGGEKLATAPFETKPFQYHIVDIEELIENAAELLNRDDGFGTIQIISYYKLATMAYIRNKNDGSVAGMDHLSPYFF